MATKPFNVIVWCTTAFMVVVLGTIVWTERRLSAITPDVFTALVDKTFAFAVAVAWPIALVLVVLALCATADHLLPMALQALAQRQNADTFVSESLIRQLEETSDTFTGRLTRLITEAYDQYLGPMTPDLVLRLQQKLKREVENGRTDVLRNKDILWLHREPRHDRLESLAFQICGALVHWCFTVDDANEMLAKRIEERKRPFDLIISHMGNNDDAFTLYPRLPKEYKDKGIPFIVYTRRAPQPEFQARAAELKIQHYTNLPDELFEMVLDVLNAPGEPTPPVERVSVITDKIPPEVGAQSG